MAVTYMPRKKADQVAWAANVVEIVGRDAASYGVSTPLMTEFTAANTVLQAAWAAAQAVATRTKGTVIAADNALAAMKVTARYLVNAINALPSVTDQMKLDAGVTVRKTPTRKPAPSQSPIVTVASVSGRTVTVTLRQDGNRRAKPAGVQNALVYTYSGTTPPQDTNLWTFFATTTATTLSIPFPPSATGDTVFITAQWANAKSETGPAAEPVRVNLPAGGFLPSQQASESPKLRRAA